MKCLTLSPRSGARIGDCRVAFPPWSKHRVDKIIGYNEVLQYARENKFLDQTFEYANSEVTVADAKKVLTEEELKTVAQNPVTYVIKEVTN